MIAFFVVAGLVPATSAVAASTTINMDGQSLTFPIASATRIKDGTPTATTTTVNVTSSSYSGTTVTYNGSANGLTAGQSITITGSNVAAYNGTYTVATKSSSKFTVTRTISPAPSAGTTATATQSITPALTAETDGNVYLYSNVGPAGATPIDATVETVLSSGVTMISGKYDPDLDSYVSANAMPGAFITEANVATAGAGITFKFHFYLHGTVVNNAGTITGTDVVLQNIKITSVDLDNGSQYTDFSGFQQYTVSTTPASLLTKASITTTSPYSARFLAGSSTSNNADADTDVVTVLYSSITSVAIKVGATAVAATNAYALVFGPRTWASTPTTSSNPYNYPPTSADTALTVASGTGTVLTKADLGFSSFADLDGNSYSGIQVPASPTFTGALEVKNSSGTWIAATTGALISVADIEAGKVRFTGTAGTSIPFKVYDGLAYSTSAYSLVITVSGQSPQSISATPPGVKAPGATFTLSASASSTGPLVVSVGPSSVCTNTGLTITTVGQGTCTVTLDQPGGTYNGTTYLPAPTVTVPFTVSAKLVQTITFNRPADQLRTAGTITIAPTTTATGLTVSVTSSDTSVCTVSGFTVTLKKIGTCYLDADQAGDATYAPADQVARYFYVTNPLPTPSAPTVSSPTSSSVVVTVVSPNASAASRSVLVYLADGTYVRTVSNFTSGTAITGLSGGTSYKFAIQDIGDGSLWSDSPIGPLSSAVSTTSSGYTLTYNANGGSNPPASDTQLLSFTASSQGAMTWVGHTFTTWNTQADGNGTNYAVNSTVPNSVATLYAVWSLNTHTLSFDTGSGGSLISSLTLSYGVNMQAQISAQATPSRIGYAFSKWQIGGVDVATGQLMPDSDVVATAVWVSSAYTVSFSNGSGATTTASVNGVGYGSDLAALVASQSLPTRPGYTFSKWQIAGADIPSGMLMPANNVTVVAVWTVNSHNLSFTTGVGASTIPSQSLAFGTNIPTTLSSIANPTRSGYTFTKWQIAGADIASGSTMPDADVIVVAVWAVNTHSIIFSTGVGGSLVSTLTVSYGVNAEAQISAVATPSRIGFTFSKWQIGGADIASGMLMPDNDLNVDAVWLVNHTLTYHANGGANAPATATSTSTFTAAVPGLMSWANHAFVKWNTALNGSGTDYAVGSTVPNSVTDLYAVWVLSGNQPQAINFVQPSTQAFTDVTLTVSPQTDATGLVVDLVSDTPSVCTLSGYVITFVTTGQCTLTASQPGDQTYSPASAVTRTFRIIDITTQHLAAGQVNAAYSSPQTLAGAAGGGTWATVSALPAGITLNPTTGVLSGNPTAVFSGNVTITYTEGGATVSRTFVLTIVAQVITTPQAITFIQPSTQALATGTLNISPVTDALGLSVSVASQTPLVCTVAGNRISLLTVGLCTLVASQSGNGTYSAAIPVTRSFRIIKILTVSLALGTVGEAYRSPQILGGAIGNGRWSTVSTLPSGLSLDAGTGLISGTPGELFDRNILINYSEGGATVSVRLRLVIVQGTSAITVVASEPSPTPTPIVSPVPTSPETGSGINSIDIGRGVQAITGEPDVTTISSSDLEHLRTVGDAQIQGFKPSEGLRLDVVGSKTIGVFTIVQGASINISELAKTLPTSGSADSFIGASTLQSTTAASAEELKKLVIDPDDRFFFESSGLGSAETLSVGAAASAKEWVKVSVPVIGFKPGSSVYLVMTSSPIVFGQATVGQDGRVVVSGSMALDLLPTGVHRLRVLGNRDLGAVSSNENGGISLTAEQLAEIRKFDEGTFATIRIFGGNDQGGQTMTVRLIPILKDIPWWLLWAFGVLVLASLVLRRRRILETPAARTIKRIALTVVGLALVGVGIIVGVPVYWIVAAGLTVIQLAGSWLVRVRGSRSA